MDMELDWLWILLWFVQDRLDGHGDRLFGNPAIENTFLNGFNFDIGNKYQHHFGCDPTNVQPDAKSEGVTDQLQICMAKACLKTIRFTNPTEYSANLETNRRNAKISYKMHSVVYAIMAIWTGILASM